MEHMLHRKKLTFLKNTPNTTKVLLHIDASVLIFDIIILIL